MAFPTTVNDQITDTVTQTNTKNLGEVPGIALATLTQATAQASANAAHNTTSAQQTTSMIGQAAATLGINMLNSMGAAILAKASKDVNG